MTTRSSPKGKKCWNRHNSGTTISSRLSVGLPADLDAFLTEKSDAMKICKAEVIRSLIRDFRYSSAPVLSVDDKFVWAVSAFSEHFGGFATRSSEGCAAWDGETSEIWNEYEKYSYWLYLQTKPNVTVEINDIYTLGDNFPPWGIAYVVGYCEMNDIPCKVGSWGITKRE